MIYSAQFIKDLDKLEPDLKAVLLELLTEIERNREESITRKEFWEFSQKTDGQFQKTWQALDKLAAAQQRTEKRVEELAAAQQRTEKRVEELAAAQQRTEKRVEELAEAQQRTEKRVEELAAAQQRTEKRVEELAAAQQRTEKRVEELAAAQQRTEEALTELIHRVDNIEVQLGGLSNTVGYGLEDRSYLALKRILNEDFGFEIDKLRRINIVYSDDRFDEINIYGEAQKNRQKVYIIGECKAQFGVKDVKKFEKLLERVHAHLGGEIFPLALSYQFHPKAEARLKELNLKYFWSHDLIEQ